MDTGTNRVELLDLTKLLDENLPIYTDGHYSDPPFQVEPWCTVPEQGYKVSRLALGTQTGTHIDAPAHFVAGGATLEALPLPALIGPYLWVDLNQAGQADAWTFPSSYRDEPILFLTSSSQAETEIAPELLAALLALPCPVWLIVYGVRVRGQGPLYFNRAVAEAGKYLIEEVDEVTARRVRAGGEIIALPLRLSKVSGSPCRVVVRQAAPLQWPAHWPVS